MIVCVRFATSQLFIIISRFLKHVHVFIMNPIYNNIHHSVNHYYVVMMFGNTLKESKVAPTFCWYTQK